MFISKKTYKELLDDVKHYQFTRRCDWMDFYAREDKLNKEIEKLKLENAELKHRNEELESLKCECTPTCSYVGGC